MIGRGRAIVINCAIGLLRTSIAIVLAKGTVVSAYQYTVVEGDTLSEIAEHHIPGKIYGKGGTLEKVNNTNPQIKNPDLIFPGQVVELGGIIRSHKRQEPPQTVKDDTMERAPLAVKRDTPPDKCSEKVCSDLGILDIIPKLSYRRIATQASLGQGRAYALSNLGKGLGLTWRQPFGEKIHGFIGADFIQYKYQITTGLTLNNASQINSKIFAGIDYLYHANHGIKLALGVSRESVLKDVSYGVLTLENIIIPVVGLEYRYRLFSHNNYSLWPMLDVHALFPGSGAGLRSKMGYALGGKLGFSKDVSWGSLQSDIYYRYTGLELERSEQDISEAGILFEVRIESLCW